MKREPIIVIGLMLILPAVLLAGEKAVDEKLFNPKDVFQLEYASDPQISPDGSKIVYVRTFMDIMKDRRRTNLWIINYDGTGHRPLTSGNRNDFSPRWSPDGDRLLYASTADGSNQLYMRWMDTGQTAKLTNLTSSPGGLSWSPDGKWIALSMLVKESPPPFAEMPAKPEGAEWAKPARVIRKLQYRADGRGYLEDGFTHLFVLSAEGGTPRQITSGEFNHGGAPSWTPDSRTLIFSANRHDDWQFEPLNSEIYEVALADGSFKALTDRYGPDASPVVSPDGKKIAYLGFDDKHEGYQVTKLYVMNRDGSDSKLITGDLDRGVGRPRWSGDGKGVYVQYDTEGNTRIAYVGLNGKVQDLASDVGGLSLGRPYAGGMYSVSPNGRFAFTQNRPDYPADLAVGRKGAPNKRLTMLNADLFGHKELAAVEEIWYESSHDGRKIQGWIAKPPGFDPSKKYPLLLEIHGGPFANYGDRFSAEVQLFASAGYVVLYTNPRGSTSYGKEFGNLIHHNYPGEDYDDLMSGVDAVIAKGYIDEGNLFITGGSGGGVLTSWTVGKTGRFKAAVVAKPVINWYSFALTADMYTFFYKYWFPGFPWDYPDAYLKRSPLSLVGNVTTPTMLLTGEADYRTPMSESEQYYQALKLRKIDTALVRIPDASHGIATRPSNLISKVAHILAWFEKYRTDKSAMEAGTN
ncbi:S9 family peptidase [bacterium]|nr:S9 family peptidase [bacterium]